MRNINVGCWIKNFLVLSAQHCIKISVILLFFVFLFGCDNSYKNELKPSNESQLNESDNSSIYDGNHENIGDESECTRVTALIPFIEQGLIQGVTCQSCHTAHHSQWSNLTIENHGDYYTPEANCEECHGQDLSQDAPQVDWISCNVCHHGDGGMAEGHAGLPCEQCHDFSGGGGGPGGDCFQSGCHGDSGSHATHTTSNSKGPSTPLECEDCHDTSNYPSFADGLSLSETHVCDTCHSPDGPYDGVDDQYIGAKPNWHSMVYNETGDALQTNKEQWCVGCHDDDPATPENEASYINGVYASNIGGDGINYGYYISGHTSELCTDCHDLAYSHIDGSPRTYEAPDDIYSPGDYYQLGYRLKSVDGETPMTVPYLSNDPVPVDSFNLCFSCHNNVLFTDQNNLNTNFRDNDPPGNLTSNYHFIHLASKHNPDVEVGCSECHSAHHGSILAKPWDSDCNGVGDSDMSCSTCHNVHGSKSPAMIRSGELIGHEPGLNLKYIDSIFPDPWNFKDPQTLEGSTGGAMDLVEAPGGVATISDNGICLMCHKQRVSYYRTPSL